MLMEDFELSPEITHHCAAEIQKDCGGVGKEGKTIHCLMGLAQIENKLNKDCEAAVSNIHGGAFCRIEVSLYYSIQ